MRKTTVTPLSCQGNVFDPVCPARAVLEVLAEKWALLLIHTLADGPARTAELRRRRRGTSSFSPLPLSRAAPSGFGRHVLMPEFGCPDDRRELGSDLN